jgi:hypothetical protein
VHRGWFTKLKQPGHELPTAEGPSRSRGCSVFAPLGLGSGLSRLDDEPASHPFAPARARLCWHRAVEP